MHMLCYMSFLIRSVTVTDLIRRTCSRLCTCIVLSFAEYVLYMRMCIDVAETTVCAGARWEWFSQCTACLYLLSLQSPRLQAVSLRYEGIHAVLRMGGRASAQHAYPHTIIKLDDAATHMMHLVCQVQLVHVWAWLQYSLLVHACNAAALQLLQQLAVKP
jgi:hypothetical protein